MISSLNNAAVKATVKLRKRRERERRGAFLVEGHRAVAVALESGAPVTALFHLQRARHRTSLLDRAGLAGAKISEVADAVMAHLTVHDHPPDVVAVALRRDAGLKEACRGVFCVVLAGIADPSVAGGIMAAAAGAGATGIVALEGVTDVFAPACVRAANGAHFVVPVAVDVSGKLAADALAGRELFVLTGEGSQVCSTPMSTPVALVVCDGEVPDLFGAAARVAVPIPSHGVGPGLVARAAMALYAVTLEGAAR